MTFREIEFGSEEYRRECALRNQVLRVPLGLSLYDEDLAREGGQMHFGLFLETTLVASAIAVAIGSREARIRQMAVRPESQHQGCGRKLLQAVERQLGARGFEHFWLHARTTVAGFYEKLGYARTGPEFTEVGIPHVKMEKRTTAAPATGKSR